MTAYLVRALGAGWRGREQLHLAVRLGDVVPDREARLKQEAGTRRIRNLDSVGLDANVPGRVQDVHTLPRSGSERAIFSIQGRATGWGGTHLVRVFGVHVDLLVLLEPGVHLGELELDEAVKLVFVVYRCGGFSAAIAHYNVVDVVLL